MESTKGTTEHKKTFKGVDCDVNGFDTHFSKKLIDFFKLFLAIVFVLLYLDNVSLVLYVAINELVF